MLNENELLVLKACADNALDAAGGDFGFGDEIKGYVEFTDKQVAGYLSQLYQKDMIYIDACKTDTYDGTQITFPYGQEKGGLKALLDAGIVDEAYVERFNCWHC